MNLQSLSSDEIRRLLEDRIRIFRILNDQDRERIVQAVQDQISQNLPKDFILSSARTLARQRAAEAEEVAHPADAEMQQFIQENALPPDKRVSAKSQPRREAKARAREELSSYVREIIREARSAKQPHERKKMRRQLLGIDQARLHRVLGTEGQQLVEEIRELLLRSTDLR